MKSRFIKHKSVTSAMHPSPSCSAQHSIQTELILVQTGLMKEKEVKTTCNAKNDLFSDYFIFNRCLCIERNFRNAVATYSFTTLCSLPFHSVFVHFFVFSFFSTVYLFVLWFPIKYAQYFAALRINKIQQYLFESYFRF